MKSAAQRATENLSGIRPGTEGVDHASGVQERYCAGLRMSACPGVQVVWLQAAPCACAKGAKWGATCCKVSLMESLHMLSVTNRLSRSTKTAIDSTHLP